MAIRGILIDLYGTLVSGNDTQTAQVCRAVAEQSPMNITAAQVAACWWELEQQKREFVLQSQLDRDILTQVAAHFESRIDVKTAVQFMEQALRAPVALADGRMFMTRLPLPCCVVTNGDDDVVQSALQHGQITTSLLVTSQQAGCYKPDPGIYRLALEKLDLPPEQVLMVGDSLHYDIAPAARLGMHTAWLNRKGRPLPRGSVEPKVSITSLMALKARMGR